MVMAQEPAKEKPVTEKRDKFIVAAIDFGTTYSGYAYSQKCHFEKDPTLHIIINKWGGTLMSQKAPTCVLFDEDGEFDCFGFEAEERYTDITMDEDEDIDSWYYFQRFKMALHGQKINRHLMLKDVRGKELPAIKVFSESIKYLKEQLLDALAKKATTMTLEDIHWVLTVPAIWSDAAKQFMREAAVKAGINSALLSIALEPEAASLYCQHQHVEQEESGDDQAQQSVITFRPPKPGTKYAVIDLGGGTADITVHEKQDNGTLKIVTQASGGAWGGMYVNIEFDRLLISIFGADVVTEFQSRYPTKALEMQRDFESKKRSIKEPKKPKDEKKKHTLCSVEGLQDLYKEKMKEDIKTGIKGHRLKTNIDFAANKLRVDFPTFKSLFKPCLVKIERHIKELLAKPGIRGTKVFLLVGGFSESDLVYAALKKALPDANVLNPPESGLAVLKGAVIFGHSPVSVSSRIAKYTYGINISPVFEEETHPSDRKVTIGGVSRCRDVFKKYIEKGTHLTYGMQVPGKHVTVREFQTDMLLKIFVSEKENPKYCDEIGTEYAGNLVVKLPRQKERIVVEVNLIVGETELKVEAKEQATNKTFEAFFDFL